jgi:hypothetical protein
MRLLLCCLCLLPIVAHAEDHAADTQTKDPKKDLEHPSKEQVKKGALKPKADPAKDLHVQKQNVTRLNENAARDRKAGNRVGAWAAEQDSKHAQKQITKDEKAMKANDEGDKK